MKPLRRFGPGAAIIFLSGCAWVPQTAHLKLNCNVEPANIGSGTSVAVRVIDKRPSSTLGRRGWESKNAAITTDQDVPLLFQDNIVEGLRKKGFHADPFAGQPGLLLTVEIRQIEYATDMEFMKGSVKVKASLRALASKNGVPFDQTYSAEHKETILEAPKAKTNERMINEVISESVQKLFEDERLFAFLAF